ncbi:hypothetical protein ScPMuIL_002995 [Solemya velum]
MVHKIAEDRSYESDCGDQLSMFSSEAANPDQLQLDKEIWNEQWTESDGESDEGDYGLEDEKGVSVGIHQISCEWDIRGYTEVQYHRLRMWQEQYKWIFAVPKTSSIRTIIEYTIRSFVE